MVKVSVTLEGSPEELIPVLRQVADLQTHEPTQESAGLSTSSQTQEESLSWNEDKVGVIWRNLSLGCREILREIAKHEDGITTDTLMVRLQLTPYEVGGRLSSLGHQLRIHECDKLPYPLDWTPGLKYRMISIWRHTISEIEKE